MIQTKVTFLSNWKIIWFINYIFKNCIKIWFRKIHKLWDMIILEFQEYSSKFLLILLGIFGIFHSGFFRAFQIPIPGDHEKIRSRSQLCSLATSKLSFWKHEKSRFWSSNFGVENSVELKIFRYLFFLWESNW